MTRWRGWRNAEIYDHFVREHGVYRALNERLVELARIDTARRVLDLACGTGATTRACLARLPSLSDVVGVDGSPEMVAVAEQIPDPRAHFLVGAASALHEVLHGTFDRVVCNAAFWQFAAIAPVLEALARLLDPGGFLAFNVPVERVVGEVAPIHPFQAALARSIERRSRRRFVPDPTSIDRRQLAEQLHEAGFDAPRIERFTYQGRQGELVTLMEVPAMIAPLTPGWSDRRRHEALLEASRTIDLDEPVEVPWLFFVVRRR